MNYIITNKKIGVNKETQFLQLWLQGLLAILT